MQRALARNAAIERDKASYIPIECGHWTTFEAQERWRAFRPGKGKVMCEKCDKWLAVRRPVQTVSEPDQEPLF